MSPTVIKNVPCLVERRRIGRSHWPGPLHLPSSASIGVPVRLIRMYSLSRPTCIPAGAAYADHKLLKDRAQNGVRPEHGSGSPGRPRRTHCASQRTRAKRNAARACYRLPSWCAPHPLRFSKTARKTNAARAYYNRLPWSSAPSPGPIRALRPANGGMQPFRAYQMFRHLFTHAYRPGVRRSSEDLSGGFCIPP